MPKNDLFSFNILLGGQPVTEYERNGETYVMTNLMHATTYQEERLEFVDDREERQKIPVTPYQVAITMLSSKKQEAWAKLFVDGSFVKQVFLDNGKEHVVKGFSDGDKVREFLFSLPRFGHDKDDRIEENRMNKVGCITVELYNAIFLRYEMRDGKRARSDNALDYTQATKKDASIVTKGKYTMATTKPGRFIEKPGSKRKHSFDNSPKRVSIWDTGKEIGKLEVKYHMRHTLIGMGIEMLE